MATTTTLLLVGVYVAYTAVAGLGLTNEQGGISAGVLPAVAGVGLCLICVLILLRPTPVEPDTAPVPAVSPLRRWLVLGVVVAGVVVVEVIGFVVMSGLVAYALMGWVERAGHVRAIAFGAAVAATVWAIFVAFLGVPLPRGTLWAA